MHVLLVGRLRHDGILQWISDYWLALQVQSTNTKWSAHIGIIQYTLR